MDIIKLFKKKNDDRGTMMEGRKVIDEINFKNLQTLNPCALNL